VHQNKKVDFGKVVPKAISNGNQHKTKEEKQNKEGNSEPVA